MKTILSTPIGRLRVASIADAVSYLLLLGVAMPLKYLGDMPEATMLVGSIHGGLFVALCLAIALALWSGLPLRLGLAVFLLSVVPFGPFFIDPALRRADEAGTREGTPDDPPAPRGRATA